MSDGQRRKSIDIVIQGSGTKAAGALGAILELHAAGYRFERVSGTSSGAVVAALVTAYQKAGRDLAELESVMASLDFSRFEKPTLVERLTGVVGEGAEMLLRGGAFTVDYLYEWLPPLLREVGVATFGDLRVDDPDSSLPPAQRYSLLIHCADLSRHCHVRLPWDYGEYGHSADEQPIVDAVAASMAFPFIFEPVQFTTGSGGTVTWVDGGLVADYPLTTFDRTDGRLPRWPTWGITMFNEPEPTDKAVRSTPGIILNSFLSMLEWGRYGQHEEGTQTRSICVDPTGVDDVAQELNFRVTDEQKSAMLKRGREAAAAFLAKLPADAT
jgi:NTE family protein